MRRRALTGQLDQLKAERNEAVKADARLMKEKGALPPDVRESRRALGERIDRLEAELKGVEEALDEKLLYVPRSEEHTSELQSLTNLVCRLLLEKKKKNYKQVKETNNEE